MLAAAGNPIREGERCGAMGCLLLGAVLDVSRASLRSWRPVPGERKVGRRGGKRGDDKERAVRIKQP